MKRIYIAGPLSPRGIRVDGTHPAIEYLMNVRDMIQAAVACIDRGWAPFCPALDFSYFVSLPAGQTISEESIKGVSVAWLEVSDAIFMVGLWQLSSGALAEYNRALELKIPVFVSINQLEAK